MIKLERVEVRCVESDTSIHLQEAQHGHAALRQNLDEAGAINHSVGNELASKARGKLVFLTSLTIGRHELEGTHRPESGSTQPQVEDPVRGIDSGVNPNPFGDPSSA